MVYKGNLRKEVTPSRLLSFLNLINSGHYTKNELKYLIYPPNLVHNPDADYNRIFNFAREINLINENNQGKIYLLEDHPIMKTENGEIDENSFIECMDQVLFSNADSVFYKITNSLLKKDNGILKAYNAGDIARLILDDIRASNEDILAWRFWAKYLGYAYNLLDEFIIVNPYRYIDRVNQIIFRENLKPERLRFADYISQLINKAPIFNGCTKGNRVSFPLSLALMTLHNTLKIELAYIKDARDMWFLEGLPLSGNKQISHVNYGGTVTDEC